MALQILNAKSQCTQQKLSRNTESGFESTLILTEDCISCIVFHTRSFKENKGMGTFSQEARPVGKLHMRRVVQRKTGRSSFTSTCWFVILWTKLCLPQIPWTAQFHAHRSSINDQQADGKGSSSTRQITPQQQHHFQLSHQEKTHLYPKMGWKNRQRGQLLASKLPLCN